MLARLALLFVIVPIIELIVLIQLGQAVGFWPTLALVVGTGVLGAALAGYGADEARLIAGLRSNRIAEVLGYPGRAAMAHRDDMVVWGS
ncbi:MAG: FxsA family protein [Gemmatimonadetes bacterium]|nr:FxsA family protein [Gemmatimonadota bacterium]